MTRPSQTSHNEHRAGILCACGMSVAASRSE
jgi:hypothetical protein